MSGLDALFYLLSIYLALVAALGASFLIWLIVESVYRWWIGDLGE